MEIIKKIWIFLVKLSGWKFILPEEDKREIMNRCVFVTAPHTSAWDFIVGGPYLWLVSSNGKFFIKKEFFLWPLGGFLRRLGGIPIDRGNIHNHIVDKAVKEFKKGGPLSIAITPEGTRRAKNHWSKGFWEIAHQAGVPIVATSIDYSKKQIKILKIIRSSDNYETDLEIIWPLYSKKMARYPEKFVEYGECNSHKTKS